MGETTQPTNAKGAEGCLTLIALIIGLFVFAHCSRTVGGDDEVAEMVDYCPSHRESVLSAEAEVSRIKALIATADAAAETGNASSLQGYLDFRVDARKKLESAERELDCAFQ